MTVTIWLFVALYICGAAVTLTWINEITPNSRRWKVAFVGLIWPLAFMTFVGVTALEWLFEERGK